MAHKMADVKSETQLRAAFSLFDFSGDGYIQAEEVRAAHPRCLHASAPRAARARAQMQRIMMNVGEPVTIQDINQLIREVDHNGDGAVDYEEFAKVVSSEKPVTNGMTAAAAAKPAGKSRRRFLGII